MIQNSWLNSLRFILWAACLVGGLLAMTDIAICAFFHTQGNWYSIVWVTFILLLTLVKHFQTKE